MSENSYIDLSLRTAQRKAIQRAVEACANDLDEAARVLGIRRLMLDRKMEQLGLKKNQRAIIAKNLARDMDFYRQDIAALRRNYYAFIRDTGRVIHAGATITIRAQKLISEFDRVPPQAGELSRVNKIKRLLDSVSTFHASVVGAA